MLKVKDPQIESKIRTHVHQTLSRILPPDQLEVLVQANTDDSYRGQKMWDNFVAIWQHYLPLSPKARVLDLGSSTGSVVFNAQKADFQAVGLEPEPNKIFFSQQKNRHYRETGQLKLASPPFVRAVGEQMPFKDNSMDVILTHQTLEHVQDVKTVLEECIRVLAPGGIIYIAAPEYFSFYEAHYGMFWLPFFPKKLAKAYLYLRNRDPGYIDSITYTTKRQIIKYLKRLNTLIFDQRMLGFYQQLKNELKDPNIIPSPLKRLIYKTTKKLKLTVALEFIEQLKFRITHRWVYLVVIKKPYELQNPLIKKIRIF